MRLSGTTNTSGLNVQLRDNLISLRNLNDEAVHLSLASDQSIGNAAYAAVAWSVKDWQVGNSTIWTSASGTKLGANVAGYYKLTGSLEWRGNASGYRGAAWALNGTTIYHLNTRTVTLSSIGPAQPTPAIVQMTTADFVRVMVFQNTGAALGLRGGNPDRTRCGWRLIAAAT